MLFFLTFFSFVRTQNIHLGELSRRTRIVRARRNRTEDRNTNPPASWNRSKEMRKLGSRASARQNLNFHNPGADHVQRSEAVPSPLLALQCRNSIKVLAHGPKEIPFSRISRSLSGGTTAYVGPGATRATVLRQHKREEPVLFVG